jgi:ketosteroid isomerase-like protein
MPHTGPDADRQQLRELLERYCDAVNQRDAVAWGANWAEDGEWNLPALGITGLKGRAKIVETWSGAMTMFSFANMLTMPGSIEVDGERAKLRSYTSEYLVMPDGTVRTPKGQYDDVCVKRGGRWYFLSRTFAVLHG